MKLKLRLTLIITLIMTMSAVFYGCGGSDINVRVKQATKKPLEAFAFANGAVEAEDVEEVYFDRGTRIDNVYVKIGDEVNEDQKLVQYNSDKLKLSSIDGVITQVNIRKGQVVDSTKPSIVVMDATKLIVKADVKQRDISNVQVGQEVNISGDALPKERKIVGKVEEISQVAKTVATQALIEVKVRIDGQVPEALKAGMSVSCDIKLSRKENALVITYDAIKEVGGDKFVFVVKGGKLEERKVILGASYGITVEVKEGLSEGENVVLDPKIDYAAGMSANIVSTEK